MKNKKEINKKAYLILYGSALIACAIIVVVGIACYFSGYKLSATAHFWLWVIILVSAAAMTLSLIRIILDLLPIKYKRGDKQSIATESDKVLTTTTKADMESLQEDAIETHEDAIETEFHHKFVADKFMKRPVYKILKSLIDEDPGGKNAVLILICAKDKEWLTSFLSYQEAKKYFGEIIDIGFGDSPKPTITPWGALGALFSFKYSLPTMLVTLLIAFISYCIFSVL